MTRFPTARRAAHLDRPNPLRALTEVIDKVPGGINLGQGVCDLDTPAPLVAGARACIEGEDRQTYTPYLGLPGLREQIANRRSRSFGHDISPDQVCATLGSSGAFFATCQALFEPGSEVVLFEPFYSYHISTLRLCGLVPVPVPLAAGRDGGDLALDLDALREVLGPKTAAVVVNTPANPSGKVFSRDELQALGELLDATAPNVTVLTDEVYEYMVFDGRQHIAPATVSSLAERTLTLSSFSKTFSVTGWRVGYLAGDPEVVDRIGRVCDQVHVCAPRPMQRGIERALSELGDEYYRDLSTSYQAKRDKLVPALRRAGFNPTNPAGAYYVLADYREIFGDIDPMAAVRTMIDKIGINAVPGSVFHADPAGVHTIRFHFAVEDQKLDEVCRRITSLA